MTDSLSTATGEAGGNRSKRPPQLNGLILTGGKSRRMGQDKVLLRYGGQPHLDFLFSLLRPHCTDIRISTRADQVKNGERSRYPATVDSWGDIGPIGGILSAFRKQPGAAWLVLACDMPFLDFDTVSQLVVSRNPGVMATCFLRLDNSHPEPLCAIYEPQAYEILVHAVKSGNHSPRSVLQHASVHGIVPASHETLNQVNTPEEYRLAIQLLAQRDRS